MKKKNRILLIFVAVLLAIAVILGLTKTTSTLRKNVSDFAVKDTASITKIFIADKNNQEVTISRDSSGSWIVNRKHLAQTAKVNSFMKTLAELQVRSPVPLAARNNVITRMATLSRKIEIYQVVPRISLFRKIKLFPHEVNTKTYYVGDVTQDNQGTFMLMEGSEEPYIVFIPGFRGFVSARYSSLESDWRDYTVFNIQIGDISSLKVEFPWEPFKSYLLEVENENTINFFGLPDSQLIPQFDTIRVLDLLASFTDVRFEALLNNMLPPNFIDSVSSSRPKTVITVTKRDGSQKIVKLYYKKGFSDLYQEDGAALEPFDLDRAYATLNDGEDFVLVQYFVFDRVTRSRQYLLGQE